MSKMDDVLVMILAGGLGERLMPLTRDRAEAAVPFAGRYRLIDFVISNMVNSGYFKINVLTQYKASSLNSHLSRAWRLAQILDQYVAPVPAQQNMGPQWYRGSADAVLQNLNLIDDEQPRHVCIFGADHIYRMDVRQMVQHHEATNADVTVSMTCVPIEEARRFGVVSLNSKGRIVEMQEKPLSPIPMPGDPTRTMVSMGNYVFKPDVLIEAVKRDAKDKHSQHDFGRDILPKMCMTHHVQGYDFRTNHIPGLSDGDPYWMDVGTVDSFHQASMDLVSVVPGFDLYNQRWPIRTDATHHPPAKFVHGDPDRAGIATSSMVSEGCVVSGGRISRSILFPEVRVHSYSRVDDSILFNGVEVGRHAKIKNTIIDKGVKVPPGTVIGYDVEEDRKRFFVSDNNIVVIPKNAVLEPPTHE